ncbi:S8 family serine peptidase [Achromobacter sp. Marseille-Q0513]|uniref:S8 family serine peptidase n=1 Tax=Achromobacter sp. Marseille-Q0513 TaxID=2829161 RepID=UPI001B933511|nr:S8 family serine peptidase [Achromobacter sp. Marseille-Q0513]MBR8655752.1 S8 family serine peptidase [Achromobacter sp. Marseille-Q0513]
MLGVRIDLNGSGATQAQGQAGNDTLVGTAGNDGLIGGAGADKFLAGAGSDLLVIDADDRQADIDGGAGIDTVVIADDRGVTLNLYQANVEVVYGGYGADVLVGGGADNYFIEGGAGDDYIRGGSADDALSGQDGDDVIYGEDGDDLIRGGRGNDRIFGGNGGDVIDGGAGDDVIDAGAGNDVISASAGRDTIDGGAGIDLIELSGALSEYRFVRTANGGYQITDLVQGRDGTMVLTNVEKFSFKTGTTSTTLDLGLDAPLPVDDRIVVAASGNVTIATASLLANDLDFQSLDAAQLSIHWVGDAVGGSVSLSQDGRTVTFTRAPGHTGPIEFSYRVKDAQGNTAPIITSAADSSVQSEMKARVLMVPANAPTDPDYVKQWYLGAVGAPAVWDRGYTGKGVKVLVLEPSGEFAVDRQVADLNHADLAANRSAYFKDTATHSAHATQVAGVIGAARNGIGGVGVAHEATLDSKGFIPFSSPAATVARFREDLMTMRDYDVVNNSWGQGNPDQFGWFASLQAGDPAILLQTQAEFNAQKSAATTGRGGLGTVMVYAAGNQRAKGYDAGLNTLTSNEYTINVGGINQVGNLGGSNQPTKAFSERGANILVAAPASNIVTANVSVETPDGEKLGGDNTETQGTSLAAPIVAGIAALMLQANPKLTYRDVQTILALTARKNMGAGAASDTVWSGNQDKSWNGEGMHFSHDFGFGMVDAAAAVRMAETWVSPTKPPVYTDAVGAQEEALPDGGQRILTFDLDQTVRAEQVLLQLNIGHLRWSDLVVTLISPNGTRSILLDRPGLAGGIGNPAASSTLNVDLMSVHFRGEDTKGRWQLLVEDKAAGAAGTSPIHASLQIVGAGADQVRRYVLTDEYAGRMNIAAEAGPTELNASALSQAVYIDLSGATASRANGYALGVNAGIDRVVGTDGDDTLIGGAENDNLIGGRGNDRLIGGDGKDRLEGGQGSDTLSGGGGKDVLLGGIGDTLTGGDDADTFVIEDDGIGTTVITDFNAAAGDTLTLRSARRLVPGAVTQTLRADGLLLSYAGGSGTRSVLLQGQRQILDDAQLGWMSTTGEIKFNPVSGAVTNKNIVQVSALPIVGRRKPYARDGLMVTEHGVYFNGVVSGGVVSYQHNERIGYNPTLERVRTSLTTWADFYRVGNDLYTLDELARNFEIIGVNWGPQGTDGDDLLVAGAASANPVGLGPEWERALKNSPRSYYAGAGNDEIIGDDSAEVLDGGAGDDLLTGNGGDDRLYGGAGADILMGGAGDDVLNGGDGNDYLDGGAGNDTLDGGAGDDTLLGTAGSDTLNGGAGDDTLRGVRTDGSGVLMQGGEIMWYGVQHYGSDVTTMRGGAGDDVLIGSGYLYGEAGNDRLTGSGLLDGGDGDDTLTSLGGILTGGAGADRFVFGPGFKTSGIVDLEALDSVEFLDAANLRFTVTATYASVDVNSFSARVRLTNQDGQRLDLYVPFTFSVDRLAANDIELVPDNMYFQGGPRASLLLTGKALTQSGDVIVQEKLGLKTFDTLGGDDIVYARKNNGLQISTGDGNDLVYALAGGNRIDTGAGNDRVEMLAPNGAVGADTLVGGGGDDVLRAANNGATLYGDDVAGTLSGNDQLYGGAGNDTLYGGGGNDILDGGGQGDDTFYGGAGNDVLRGGAGKDVMDGGADDDRLDGGAGDDTLAGGAGQDELVGGDGNDKLYGGDGNDRLTGGNGDDELRGDAGDDVLSGGNGADTLYGGAGNDSLSGGAGNNVLYGDDGNDLLNGGDFNDELYGGAGNDTLIGGDGVNLYDGGTGDDVIIARSGTDTIRVGSNSGNDTVWALSAADTIVFTDVASNAVTFDLFHQIRGTIKWGANSLTLKDFSDDTTVVFADGVRKKLRDYEPVNDGYIPVDFGWVAVYDSGLIGDKTKFSAYAGTASDDHLYGGPILPSEAAYWYVVGREGNDELAGGPSGAILDGGEGDDKYLATNGITIIRGSYRADGEDTLVVNGQTPESLIYYRVPNPLYSYGYSNASGGVRGHLTELEYYLQQTKDPLRVGFSGGYTGVLPPADTLRIQSRDGKMTVDIVGYFAQGIEHNNVKNISFNALLDDQGKPLVRELAGLLTQQGRMIRTDPDMQLMAYGGQSAPNFLLDQAFGIANSRKSSLVTGAETGEMLEGRISFRVGGLLPPPADAPSWQYNYTASGRDLTASGYGNFGSAPNWALIDKNSYRDVIALSDILLGYGGDDTLWGGGAYLERVNLSDGTRRRDTSMSTKLWSGQIYGSEYTLKGSPSMPSERGTPGWDGLLRDYLNGGDGNDTYIYRKGDGGMTVMALLSRDAGAAGIDRLVMQGYRRADVQILIGENGRLRITGGGEDYNAADVVVEQGANGELQVDMLVFDDITVSVRSLIAASTNPYLPRPGPADVDMPSDSLRNLQGAVREDRVVLGTANSETLELAGNVYARGREGADTYVFDRDTLEFGVVQMDRGDRVMERGASGYNNLLRLVEYRDDKRSRHGWELGYLDPAKVKDGKFSLDAWVPVSGDNERATDVLLKLERTRADGTVRISYLVLADVMGAAGTYYGMFADLQGAFDGGLDPNARAVYGTMGNDSLTAAGPAGSVQSIYGRGGDDTIAGSSGFRVNYKLYGGTGNDTIYGADGQDYLDGGEGNDTLYGGKGDDTLAGGAGRDWLAGGEGDDTYIMDDPDLYLEISERAGEGSDTIRSSIDLDLRPYVNVENIHLVGTQARVATGNDGANRLTGNGAGSRLEGLGGNDVYVINGPDIVVEAAGGGYDAIHTTLSVLQLAANVEALVSLGSGLHLTGNALDNELHGDAGANVMYGLDGDDLLNAGMGDDTLSGGRGNDLLYGGGGNDTYIFKRGDGRDTIVHGVAGMPAIEGALVFGSDINARQLWFSRSGNDLLVEVLGTEDQVLLKDWYARGTARVERIQTGDGVSFYQLDGVVQAMAAYRAANPGFKPATSFEIPAADALRAALSAAMTPGARPAGPPQGTPVADTLTGTAGDDVHYVDHQNDKIIEAVDGGIDVAYVSVSYYVLADNVENGRIVTSAGATLRGNALRNILYAGDGNDTIIGSMPGVYGVPSDDFVSYQYAKSAIQASLWFDHYAFEVTGGSGNDELLYIDNIIGSGFNDTIRGNQMANVIDGGSGADTMYGRDGDDVYYVDNAADVVIELAGEGIDTVHSSVVSYTLTDYVENGSIMLSIAANLSGNALNNVLYAGLGDNMLDGAGGIDTVSYANMNAGVTVSLSLAGAQATGGSGRDTLISIENLTGSRYDDILTGSDVDNVLDGGAGADRMRGGLGNDLYYVDNAGDLVLEDADGGIDTVVSSLAQYVLADNVENVRLVAAGAANVMGNALDNRIDAGAGDNVMNGGAGNDTVSYLGAAAGVTVDLSNAQAQATGGSGTDTLIGIENLVGSRYDDKLTGTSGDNVLQGGAGNDVLTGGLGSDTYVFGRGDGNDRIIENDASANHEDVLSFGRLIKAEQLWFRRWGTNDLQISIIGTSDYIVIGNWYAGAQYRVEKFVTDTGSVLMQAQVEALVQAMAGLTMPTEGTLPAAHAAALQPVIKASWANLPGSGMSGTDGDDRIQGTDGDDVMSGGAGDDTLIGGDGNDSLSGGSGRNTLIGGKGNDTYIVDSALDVIIENPDEGSDLVQASVSYTLSANVERLTLTGTAAINGTGNELVNILFGNSGANILDGGAGNDILNGFGDDDVLMGGTGNDRYLLMPGGGRDRIVENDATAGNADVAVFSGVATQDRIWFSRAANNLEVSVIGTGDMFVIQDWYAGPEHQVETFMAGGKSLLAAQVDNMVNAMAAFAPPVAGQTTLPSNYASALAPVIAANWK